MLNDGSPKRFWRNYCSWFGTLLEARSTGLALLAAKQEADAAARHANEAMLKAKTADLAKTRFLANMAHELRTPLNAIIGFSEIIKLDAIRQERYSEDAEYIHERRYTFAQHYQRSSRARPDTSR